MIRTGGSRYGYCYCSMMGILLQGRLHRLSFNNTIRNSEISNALANIQLQLIQYNLMLYKIQLQSIIRLIPVQAGSGTFLARVNIKKVYHLLNFHNNFHNYNSSRDRKSFDSNNFHNHENEWIWIIKQIDWFRFII